MWDSLCLKKTLIFFFAERLGDVGVEDETTKDEKIEQENTNQDLVVLVAEIDTIAEEQRIERKVIAEPAADPGANDGSY